MPSLTIRGAALLAALFIIPLVAAEPGEGTPGQETPMDVVASSIPHAARYERALRSFASEAGHVPEGARLHHLFDAHWAFRVADQPSWATYAGQPGSSDRWVDLSVEATTARRRLGAATLQAAESVDAGALSPEDRLNLELFLWNQRAEADGRQHLREVMRVSQMDGPQREIPDTLASQPARTRADYDAILARIAAIAPYLDQVVALLQLGVAQGVTPPQVILRDLPEQVAQLITPEAPLKSPLADPFGRMPATFSPAVKAQLSARAEALLTTSAFPAFARFQAFLENVYIPKARETTALSALPDGDAWYANDVRYYTTTDMGAEEIHQLGLSEVARIKEEMSTIMAEAGYPDDFDGFSEFLRTDPRFYYGTAEGLLAGYRDICKRIDPGLIRLFGTLPRLPYGVEAIPDHVARSQTTAYYHQGSLDAARPGTFFANTYDLKSRAKWEMEALTLHEAVPGHHLQIALAQELDDLPMFRQEAEYTAFIEGWALYAESLGGALGLYRDPYSRYGQLTYEMWRAVRLVVDTGLQTKGWSRQQAIDYFKAHSPKPEHDIIVEVDRYLAWPGQALAYKVGELRIKALRREAEAALGDGFDVRAFHDALLSGGALPLGLLEARMDAWLAAQTTGGGAPSAPQAPGSPHDE